MSIEKNIEFWTLERMFAERAMNVATKRLADLALLQSVDQAQEQLQLPVNVGPIRPDVGPEAA